MATSESLLFDGNRVQQEQEEQLRIEEDERQQQVGSVPCRDSCDSHHSRHTVTEE